MKRASARGWKCIFFDPEYSRHEKMILSASHYFVTQWEFNIVYQLSRGFYGIEDTKRNMEKRRRNTRIWTVCVNWYSITASWISLNLIGQLRFQQRWAQTQRIPETSVAGHMLIVALLSLYTFTGDRCM